MYRHSSNSQTILFFQCSYSRNYLNTSTWIGSVILFKQLEIRIQPFLLINRILKYVKKYIYLVLFFLKCERGCDTKMTSLIIYERIPAVSRFFHLGAWIRVKNSYDRDITNCIGESSFNSERIADNLFVLITLHSTAVAELN